MQFLIHKALCSKYFIFCIHQNNQQILMRQVKPQKPNNNYIQRNSRYFLQQDSSTSLFRYSKKQTLSLSKLNSALFQENDSIFINDVTKIANLQKIVLLEPISSQDYSHQQNSVKEKKYITDQQCDQLDYRARLHSKANLLNSTTHLSYQSINQDDKCKCGCHRGAGNLLPLCSDQQQMNVLGPGVILQFLYKRAIFIILTTVILIYGLFAFITNLLGSAADLSDCLGDGYCEFKHKASQQNKNYYRTNYENIQSWLGFVYCFVWIIMLRFVKVLGRVKNKYIDINLRSASDYAIKIENLPSGCYSQQQLIDYFQNLWQKNVQKKKLIDNQHSLNQLQEEGRNHFGMKSIQIIYDMDFVRQMIDQIMDIFKNKLLIRKNTIQAKTRLKDTKQQKISQFKIMSYLQICGKNLQMIRNFDHKYLQLAVLYNLTVKKTNNSFYHVMVFRKFHFLELTQKIKKCFKPDQNSILFQGNLLKIQRAPQPSDILWTNCEKKYSLKRKLIIYIAITFIVIISFGIQMGLQYAQKHVKQTKQGVDSQQGLQITIINFSMSIGLLLINQFLWFSLFYLLDLEYNHTLTDKIVSQMNHALFASSFNSIIIPILTNLIYNEIDKTNNLYKSDGLASMVFQYHMSAIIGIITGRLIDPIDLLRRLSIQIKFIRNKIIRYLSYKRISDLDFEKGVFEINQYYEGTFYDLAQYYVFIIGAIFHAAFFCQIQPFIIILVTFMILIFYISSRIRLLRLCKIPEMTELLIFQTAISHACLVPIFYGIGNIVLFYLERVYDSNRGQIHYIPSVLSILIGIIGFFNPRDCLNIIVKYLMEKCSCLEASRIIGQNKMIRQKKVINNSMQQNVNNSDIHINMQIEQIHKKTQKQTKTFQANLKTNRIQFYEENSNSLKLFGFQKVIEGKQQRQAMEQLQFFCQRFFQQQHKFYSKNSIK